MNADVHALVGAYALNALPPQEADAFTHHLSECTPCRLEVAELQATAAQLGVAVAEQPPDTLHERVMTMVQHTRQSPPAAHRQTAASTEPGPVDQAPAPRARPKPWLLAAAAAVLLILGLGVLALRPALDDTPAADADHHMMAVMHAPDARTSTTPVRGGGSITVISSRKMAAAVVMGEQLPLLDRRHDYQLWLFDRTGNPRSTGVLIGGSASEPTGPLMVENVRPGDHIGLTLERVGGSTQPTMPLLAMTHRT